VWRAAAQPSSGIETASRAVIKIRPFDNGTGLYAVFANYQHTPEGIDKQEDGGWHSLSLDRDLEQQTLMKSALTPARSGTTGGVVSPVSSMIAGCA
jgi:hypothetical protein